MTEYAHRFWTRERLEVMRDEILPACHTLDEAMSAARKRWNRPLTKRPMQGQFLVAFGATPGTCLKRRVAPPEPEPQAPQDSPVFLRRRIAQLERELRAARDSSQLAAAVKSMVRGAVDTPRDPPRWTVEGKKGSGIYHGVPSLFLSDVHHGETVYADQVNGANAFDATVSRERLERVFGKAVWFCDDVFAASDYPGICVPLGGDMLSGNIHEELRETNAMPIFDALLDLANCLIAGIDMLKSRFGKVFAPCVVGNHGRLDRKPRAKHGPADNYEYILYHIVARHYDRDDAVTVLVSDGFTQHYRLHNTRYMLTHGDSFRGGSGISGPILPWTLGDHRLRKQMSTMSAWTHRPTEYDVLLFGHWHQYFPSTNFVANGSVKGFDEYAKKSGFAFQPPMQAFWLTHPKWGATFHGALHCSDAPEPESAGWVSIPATAEVKS